MNTNLSHLYVSTDLGPRIALLIFDLDGNILATNTPYRVIEISSWNEVRIPAYQLDNDSGLISWPSAPYRWLENFEDSKVHFQDNSKYSEPNHLIDDTLEAIRNESFSPSFQAYISCYQLWNNLSIFSIWYIDLIDSFIWSIWCIDQFITSS